LKEIGQARALGLRYYYLGYFIPGSPRMAYKDHFRPRQYYDWSSSRWCPASAGTSLVAD
ncbi:arginyltransferase, partial [bacterium]|nr:arginyltransferase [bacterium]